MAQGGTAPGVWAEAHEAGDEPYREHAGACPLEEAAAVTIRAETRAMVMAANAVSRAMRLDPAAGNTAWTVAASGQHGLDRRGE